MKKESLIIKENNSILSKDTTSCLDSIRFTKKDNHIHIYSSAFHYDKVIKLTKLQVKQLMKFLQEKKRRK